MENVKERAIGLRRTMLAHLAHLTGKMNLICQIRVDGGDDSLTEIQSKLGKFNELLEEFWIK